MILSFGKRARSLHILVCLLGYCSDFRSLAESAAWPRMATKLVALCSEERKPRHWRKRGESEREITASATPQKLEIIRPQPTRLFSQDAARNT